MSEQAGFTQVEPLRDIDVEGRRIFTMNRSYPIIETYQRGNYIVNGEALYFAQTTLVVINDTGERSYIPYMSGNFAKKRGSVESISIQSAVV